MKTKFFILCTTVLLSVLTNNAGEIVQPANRQFLASVKKQSVAAQSFGYFRVHRMGKDREAALSWRVTNTEVDYFLEEWSYNGISFEILDEVPGSGATAYKFADATFFPGFIYYRITTYNSDGTVTTSNAEIAKAFIKKPML